MAKKKTKKIQIPQAHSYDFFVSVVDAMVEGISDLDALAEKFEVKPRTVSYYTNLGRWVGLMDGDFINDAGREFAKLSSKEKAEQFQQTMLSYNWVKAATSSGDEALEGFAKQIKKHTTLADATRKRRAKAMASLWGEVQVALNAAPPKVEAKKAEPKKADAPKKSETESTYRYEAPKKSKGPLWYRATKKVVGGIAKVAWKVAKR